jgi:hypothetical protein
MKNTSALLCLALIAFTRPAWTEPAGATQNSGATSADEQDDRRLLEEKLPPEARRRLREVLNSYSRQGYPDGEQIEERRRLMHDRMQERLNSNDKSVGSISRSEAQLRMPRLARQFDQIDTNGDGVITREEMQAARERAAMEKRETARNDNASEARTKSQ